MAQVPCLLPTMPMNLKCQRPGALATSPPVDASPLPNAIQTAFSTIARQGGAISSPGKILYWDQRAQGNRLFHNNTPRAMNHMLGYQFQEGQMEESFQMQNHLVSMFHT